MYFYIMGSSADISRNERLATNAFQLDQAKKNTEEGGVILHARHSYAVFNIEKFFKNPDNSTPHGRDEQDGFKYQAVINELKVIGKLHPVKSYWILYLKLPKRWKGNEKYPSHLLPQGYLTKVLMIS